MVRVAVNVEQLLHEAPGGIGRYTAELVRLLPGLGVDVTAFTARHSRADVDRALHAHDARRRDAGDPPAARGRALRRLARARRRRPRPAGRAGRPRARAVARRSRRPRDVPLVVTVHDAAPLVMPEAFTRRGVTFHRQGFAAAARRARLVIAVSEFCADELVDAHADPPRADPRRAQRGRSRARQRRRRRTCTPGLRDRRPAVRVLGRNLPAAQEREGAARRVRAARSPTRAAPTRARRSAGLEARRRRRRAPRRRWATGCALLGPVGRASTCSRCSPAPTCSRSRACTKGSASRWSRRWRRAPRWCAADIPALREVAGDAARFVRPDDVDGWADALVDLLTDAAARGRAGRRPGPERVGALLAGTLRCATAAMYGDALVAREALSG